MFMVLDAPIDDAPIDVAHFTRSRGICVENRNGEPADEPSRPFGGLGPLGEVRHEGCRLCAFAGSATPTECPALCRKRYTGLGTGKVSR